MRTHPARPVAFAILAAVALAAPALAQPAVRYELRYDPAAQPPRLSVSLRASGLGPGGASLVLDDWGSWTALGREYVTVTHASPPVGERDGNRFAVEIPEGWDGSIAIDYDLALLQTGTDEQRAHGILPAAGGSYLLGALANTLMRVDASGAPSERSITIEGPADWAVFTGWAGHDLGEQTSALPPPGDNGVFAIGQPFDVLVGVEGGVVCEVAQFSAGEGAAELVLDVTRRFVARAARAVGHAPPGPVRVLITDTTGGGYLTDHGLVVGLDPAAVEWALGSPYFLHLVCHELFHTWLGNMLTEASPESVVWFKEGFTDYLSLWVGAECGVLPREWFADRLLEIEGDARGSALGTVAFGDPSVAWRDGDGPLETMAYKGGAVLAFALDAELRRAGRGTLAGMLGDMLREGELEYTAASVRERVRAMGLGEFDERYIGGLGVPDVAETLVSLGYARTLVPVDVAYLGIRVEPGEGFGTVVEIDPDGPSAGSALRVGDVIGGYFPGRAEEVDLDEGLTTRFTFGLSRVHPGDRVTVWAYEDGREKEIALRPEIIPGGVLVGLHATAESERALFGER